MGQIAYLAPVGLFAGLSDSARQKIGERFPGVSLADIESAAAFFQADLQAPETEPRLAEAREGLNVFAKELERFLAALNQTREHRLDEAIGEASRIVGARNAFADLEHSLGIVRQAVRRMVRSLPSEAPELASGRLVARLAKCIEQGALPPDRRIENLLLGLVDLIFEDLMVGGDAARAVARWRKACAIDAEEDCAGALVDLIVT